MGFLEYIDEEPQWAPPKTTHSNRPSRNPFYVGAHKRASRRNGASSTSKGTLAPKTGSRTKSIPPSANRTSSSIPSEDDASLSENETGQRAVTANHTSLASTSSWLSSVPLPSFDGRRSTRSSAPTTPDAVSPATPTVHVIPESPPSTPAVHTPPTPSVTRDILDVLPFSVLSASRQHSLQKGAPSVGKEPVGTYVPETEEHSKSTLPSEWTVEQVVEWLKSKGFESDVYDKFIEQDVTGDVLLHLDVYLLKAEIGIVALGKRVRIANAITEIRKQEWWQSSTISEDYESSNEDWNTVDSEDKSETESAASKKRRRRPPSPSADQHGSTKDKEKSETPGVTGPLPPSGTSTSSPRLFFWNIVYCP